LREIHLEQLGKLKDGGIAVPSGPGLGLLPRMEEIARYRVTIR
jgi:L-alanine-DL-glutamate epimerase-like enolase superfamily enzyme